MPSLLAAAAAAFALAAPMARADVPRYAGASDDARTIFFTSAEKLVPGDTDLKVDVYARAFDESVGEAGAYVTREVSTGPTGGNDAFDATYDGASRDGDAVFFSTDESLVAADKDRSEDVYARDLGSGAPVLVSQADPSCPTVGCGNGSAGSSFFGATPDGARVFFSTDEQLTAQDSDASFDVYARSVGPGSAITLVSRAAESCGPGCGNGAKPAIFEAASTDGDKVVFSTAEGMVAGDGDQLQDVYLRNLTAGTTTLVSTLGNCPANADCAAVYRGISGSGDRVFFQTSDQIGAGDGDKASDVYVWSGAAAALVSKGDSSCAASSCGDGEQPTTFVGASTGGDRVFLETSESLTSADGDGSTDVYVRDLNAGTSTLVSPAGTCFAGLDCNAVYRGSSSDGSKVFFQTGEQADGTDSDEATDVYVRDLSLASPQLVSAGAAGCPSDCSGAEDARFSGATPEGSAAFFSTAESLSPADTDQSTDVYVRDLGSGPATTVLVSPGGVCPLSEERGCDVTFDASSEDGSGVVFSTVKRLTAEDIDSASDIYAREAGVSRLVSVGNSIELGPATPILTGTDPPPPNPSTHPAVLGHGGAGTLIKVYPTSDCSGAPTATGSSEELEAAGIGVTVQPASSTAFRATATDGSGETSACSATTVTYVQAASGGGGGGEAGGGGSPAGATAGGVARVPADSRPGVGGRHQVPQTRITFAPAAKTRVRRPVFRFVDATDQLGTSFVCRVDRRGWQGCSSPWRLQRLAPGPHAFNVKGVNSGLAEARAVVRKFRLVGR